MINHSKTTTNRDRATDGTKVKWMEIKALSFSKENPSIMYEHDEEYKQFC
ncbi:MAG: hypothetical protein GY816_19560 [Cytophagales bacterium]|nr:hypothetical protein [Cytophagales bacterium]